MCEKILADASNQKVSPGDIVKAKVDFLMLHEITGPLAVDAFHRMGFKKVWNNERIAVIFDHDIPASNVKTAELALKMRKFVKEQGIKHFYDVGRGGIAHQVLPEKGLAVPGMILVGADSHTCTAGALGVFAVGVGSTEAAAVLGTGMLWFRVPETIRILYHGSLKPGVFPKDLILHTIGVLGEDGAVYKAIEFSGETIKEMSIDGRMTITNMAVEMGAKTGLIEPDEKIMQYVSKRAKIKPKIIKPDSNANYEDTIEFEVEDLEPMVAAPYRVDNVHSVSEVEDIEIDQVFIGSCTNGRLEDLEIAAKILKGKKIYPHVRLIVIPASIEIYTEALKRGFLQVFLEAGGVVGVPSCGPCMGMSHGVLAAGETCLSTTNRNFLSRMGHKNSKVYLASPATAAASAITGHITDPRRFLT